MKFYIKQRRTKIGTGKILRNNGDFGLSVFEITVLKCIVLWVFTTKSLLPFCVSMHVGYSGCSQPSHTRMYCALCLQPSNHCLSVSAWMYCALGVYIQVITAFLCQHGCIVLWVLKA
ncbi:hypothetical protein DPMN_158612 [Dreissena polymorpha]|uniref:Uncharacterized protein n=1 Tax=Dreissena polymorpha TaxID=45954 RepID=A0A9D4EJA9_DREPO|nr:hypothetical protein DPMN_158612 [Dreissena polymorpha]